MTQTDGRIISNKEIKPGYFIMDIRCPAVAKRAKPGQFITVRCGKATSPLLRRPFGFHSIKSSSFEMLYEVVGDGTKLLSSMKPGNEIDVLGPLGNGFEVPGNKKDFILVAGGIGVAPLAALAESLARDKNNNILTIIGARSSKRLLCEDHFKDLGIKTMVSTDDGSRGKRCFTTDIFEEFLSTKGAFLPMIFACGPKPMLKTVSHIAKKHRLESYASFEENIACGVGACLGCAIKTESGYKSVCKDGPVFNLKEIIW